MQNNFSRCEALNKTFYKSEKELVLLSIDT